MRPAVVVVTAAPAAAAAATEAVVAVAAVAAVGSDPHRCEDTPLAQGSPIRDWS